MAVKKRIGLKEIKEQLILPALSTTTYRYKVFASAGAYQKSFQVKNLRVGVVNALIEMTDSDIALLGGGINAVAMNIRISFLIPVEDTTADGDYAIVEDFREQLSNSFATAQKVTLVLNAGTSAEKTFIGALSVGLPIGGQLLQRQGIGKSFEYTCYLELAFLENAVNSSDVYFYLDGDTNPIPFTSFSINRKNTLTANLYSSSSNQSSQTFAENSTFGVDLNMPAISSSASVTGKAINDYILGVSSANTPHTLKTVINGTEYTQEVIFGEVITNGGGMENVSWQVSFVPYISAEDEEENAVEG